MSNFIRVTLTSAQEQLINADDIESIARAEPDPQDRALSFSTIYMKPSGDKLTTRDTLEHLERQIGAQEARRLIVLQAATKAVLGLVEALRAGQSTA